ncbi:MAG: GNAT family N-acetyltransferase [Halioglobus sp.]|nr:GNAT family N-acetyltransferase [Halioglobus sp.]
MTFNLVDESNSDAAVHILAHAFQDDPVINWVCDTPSSLIPFFDFMLPTFICHRLTYLDPLGRGAASWLGPSQSLKWPIKLSSIYTVIKIGGLTGIYRMLLSGIQTERYHPKEPHYYLFAIGVTPANKGQGLGTSLITHMLRRCDEEGMPAYLENSKEDNLAFYKGHGFKVLREIRFSSSAPPLWLMWRDPVVPQE